MKYWRHSAFSLVELSIVLVILGLLVGGILAGQSLIRASELRSVTTQYRNFVTATQAFRDRYFYLPGDMPNASSVWGAADGTTGSTAACLTTASSGTATCNGNGSGTIGSVGGSHEWFRFWQHLANAGLIEGRYNGVVDVTASNSVGPNNSPAGKTANSYWWVSTFGSSGNSSIFDMASSNLFELGGYLSDGDPRNPIFKSEEAWNIDTKIDDGKPALGKVTVRDVSGFSGVNCTTATSSAMLTADYYLANTGTRCVFYFLNAF